MKPGANTIGLGRMRRGMVAEAADASRVIKVGEIELFGVSGNGMGVWGELALVWLCGGGVERQEQLHNGQLSV